MDIIDRILSVIIVILVIILIILSGLYVKERKLANSNLNTTLDYAMELYETNKEINEWTEKIRKINFSVNEVEEVASAKIDANSEEISIDDVPEEIYEMINSSSIIQYKLDKCYAVYTKKNKTSQEYDVIHDYVFEYSKNGKRVKIAVSEVEAPLRDTLFGTNGEVSELNGNEFTVYQHGNQYMASFVVDDTYFDIETVGLTEDLLLDIIESIFEQD